MKKMKVIADYNGRSVNKEIEQILKWVIDDFENKCGKIRTEELNLLTIQKERCVPWPMKNRKSPRAVSYLNCEQETASEKRNTQQQF
jgi:hypothetical protein